MRFEAAEADRSERLDVAARQLVVRLVQAGEHRDQPIARRLGELGVNAGVATGGIRFSLTPIGFLGIVMFLARPRAGCVPSGGSRGGAAPCRRGSRGSNPTATGGWPSPRSPPWWYSPPPSPSTSR